jgi:hypothetical protein
MDILVQHFKKSLDTFKANTFFSPRVQRSWVAFDKYYLKTEDSPYYAAAIILHPSRRTGYLKHNWDKKWVRPAIQAVKKLWDDFKNQVFIPSLAPPFEEATEDLDDDYDIFARNLANFPRPHSKDDLEEYISEHATPIDKSALSWWLDSQQRKRWPRLSQFAINILSIPAMSAEPERVFSGARRTVSWERMQLGEGTIEMLECLKHWKRSGLIGEFAGAGNIDDD